MKAQGAFALWLRRQSWADKMQSQLLWKAYAAGWRAAEAEYDKRHEAGAGSPDDEVRRKGKA